MPFSLMSSPFCFVVVVFFLFICFSSYVFSMLGPSLKPDHTFCILGGGAFQRGTSTTQPCLRDAALQCGRWLRNTWRWSENILPVLFPMYEPICSSSGTTRMSCFFVQLIFFCFLFFFKVITYFSSWTGFKCWVSN